VLRPEPDTRRWWTSQGHPSSLKDENRKFWPQRARHIARSPTDPSCDSFRAIGNGLARRVLPTQLFYLVHHPAQTKNERFIHSEGGEELKLNIKLNVRRGHNSLPLNSTALGVPLFVDLHHYFRELILGPRHPLGPGTVHGNSLGSC